MRRCSAARLRQLQPPRCYAVLVCFLAQTYRDTIDYIVDMHDKILTGVYSRAQEAIDEETRRRRTLLRTSLRTYRTLGAIVLDEAVSDEEIRHIFFSRVDRETVAQQLEEIGAWLNGKHSHVFHQVAQRFTYLRQYAPALLQHLQFEREVGGGSLSGVAVTDAIDLLRDLNRENKRKLPEDASLAFVSKQLHRLVQKDGEVNKQAWECALLTAIRDEIRASNIFVEQSKRFGRFDDFFITDTQWHSLREAFFQRAGLPARGADVPAYLSSRLNLAHDLFLDRLPNNAFASVDERGWRLSVDQADKLEATEERKLEELRAWLAKHLRIIKLPDLLIEVDNELQFTRHFMTPAQLEQREAESVCLLLATVMAHGCNIGPYTMARLTEDIDYEQIKQVTDWQLTEEAQRQALAQLVNAINNLDVTQVWGKVERPAAMANGSR